MPITSITIENFKGIGDAVTIPIRPITLLFGKNSSGKSTVLQALRYMHERCDDLKFEQKLPELEQKFQEQRPLSEAYQLLKAAHRLRDHVDPEVLKSIQKDTIKNISNDDLSAFDSRRGKALKAIQKVADLFESKDDWQSQAEVEAWERGEIYPGRFTDLGDFPSLVHRHELDRKIRIRLEFDIEPEKWKSLNDILTLAMKSESVTNPKSAWIEMVIGWDEQQKVIYLDSYKYALNGAEWICLTPPNRPMPDEAEWNYEERFIDLNIYSKKFGLSKWTKDLSWLLGTDNSEGKKFGLSEKKLKNIRSWLEKCVFEDRATNILKKLHDIVLGELDGMRHLGPVRDVPLRNQDSISTSEAEVSRWSIGLEAWDVLLGKPQLLKKTNRYMKKLALGYSIRRSEDDEHEILLYDETHKIYHHPLDVGFGISQVIPVVVGALDDMSQIFAVEQPELHVHPAVQVALGDVFIDGIKNSNRTMLIETHSEHLLLRLLRRVRETTLRSRYQTNDSEKTYHELTPNDLSVVYVRPTSAGVKFTPLTVTDKGDFDAPWPEGFFEERDSELF